MRLVLVKLNYSLQNDCVYERKTLFFFFSHANNIRIYISTFRAIWTHGGPTAAFVHIVIALCLLIPRLLIESKLIENGNLPRGKNLFNVQQQQITSDRNGMIESQSLSSFYYSKDNFPTKTNKYGQHFH